MPGQNQKKVDSLLVELIKTKNDTIEVDVLNKIFKEYDKEIKEAINQ